MTVVLREQRDRSSLRLAVDHAIDEHAILQLVGGLLRNDNAIRAMRGHHHRSTTAVMQQMTTVRECSTQRDSTCLDIDSPADGTDTSRFLVLFAVAQSKRHLGGFLDECLNGTVLTDKVEGLILAYAEIDIHLCVVGHRHQWLADVATNEGAYMPGNHRCHTADGALHLRIRKIVAGVHLLCLCLRQCRLSL